MDQLLVDCGPDSGVRCGDEVVLIVPRVTRRCRPRMADRIGTVSYEISAASGPACPQARSRRRTAVVVRANKRVVAYATAAVFSAAASPSRSRTAT